MVSYQLNENQTCAWLVLEHAPNGNALNPAFIAALSKALTALAQLEQLKVCCIYSTAKHFCVGADIAWFQSSAALNREDNIADAALLADLLKQLAALPAITIAAVHGATYGGGLGLLAACDFVLADQAATFCFSEIKLGLMPATIAPYIKRKLSLQTMRQLFFTAEKFSASKALAIGLVDLVIDQDDVNTALEKFSQQFLGYAKNAIIEGKLLFAELAGMSDALITSSIHRLASMRQHPEAQHALQAFLQEKKDK